MSKKIYKTCVAFFPLLFLVLLAACGGDGATERSPGKLRVVTTTGMIADLAGNIAGDLAEVSSLMGPGIDPHLYKASESDVRKLAEAELVLFNGLHLEGKMGDILVKMARTRPVVAVAEDISEEALREPPEFAGQYDPHIWFDVSLWRRAIEPIARELIALLPDGETQIRERADRLAEELDELDAWVETEIGSLPEDKRLLVTAHDAFGYFGDRYGMEVVGIQGISTLAEAGLQDVERVVDLLVARRVRSLFVEASVPQRTVEAVQAACRDRGHDIAIGGQLFSDSMGAAGTPEGTYLGMVQHNVQTIVAGLR